MRQMWIVCAEELRRAARWGGSWAILGLFYLVTGILYFSVFMQASNEPLRASPLELVWELQWLPNLLWVPLITMRLLASERKAGLLDSTLATPTTAAAIVGGKYLAAGVMYLLGWASVGIYMLITRWAGLTEAELAYVFDPAALTGGAIFCVGSGAMFLALGLWCSSLTRSAILAGALTVCLMMLYLLLPAILAVAGWAQVEILQPLYHLENLSRAVGGALETSALVAYGIGAAVLLFAAMLGLEQRGDQ